MQKDFANCLGRSVTSNTASVKQTLQQVCTGWDVAGPHMQLDVAL